MRVAGPDDTFDLIGLLLAQADLQLASGDPAAAEASLEDALAKARSIGARTPELVAALRLAQTGRGPSGRDPQRSKPSTTTSPKASTPPALRDARAALGEGATA